MLEVELLSYENPTSRRSNGECCDGNRSASICNDTCENYFSFCLRVPFVSCGDWYATTGVVANDSITFGNTVGQGNLSNPFTFHGTEWPFNNDGVI